MGFLDILFPKRCVGCGRVGLPAGKAGKYFCDRCTVSIEPILSNESICPVCEKPAIDGRTHPKCQSKYALDGLSSFFHYDGVVRKAIKAVKYRYISDLAKEFISLIPSESLNQIVVVCHSRESGNPVFIPIPLYPSRYRDRGFNQAEVLGKLVAQKLNITMRSDILKRVKKTVPQVEMKHRNERLNNMEDVFGVMSFWQASLQARPESHRDAGQASMTSKVNGTIYLFDDVFTTGATMRAAAKILKQAGSTFVWAITMAR